MSTKQALIGESLDALADKADDCSKLAKAQRANADKQHESAHKLEALSHALEAELVEIKHKLDAIPDAPEPLRGASAPKPDR